jgi:hypothetical protein
LRFNDGDRIHQSKWLAKHFAEGTRELLALSQPGEKAPVSVLDVPGFA